jgi:hypothetical protein
MVRGDETAMNNQAALFARIDSRVAMKASILFFVSTSE